MKQDIRYVSWNEVRHQARKLIDILATRHAKEGPRKEALKIYGVPRGGTAIASLVGIAVDTPEEAEIIVDDLYDSGATMAHYKKNFPLIPFYVLFDKREEPWKGQWLQFPWEQSPIMDVKENITRIFQFIGEDITREGLRETPQRVIKMYEDFFKERPIKFTTFSNDSNTDEMIVESHIPFFSFCEHHMIPFFGYAFIGYIPDRKLAGLSKLPRVLERFTHRLQNQERITQQVAEYLLKELTPKGVAVVLKARHMCMEMRGVEKHGVFTTTSHMTGVFKKDINCRQEFLNLIK